MSATGGGVSVVVPCFNAQRWLLDCLTSALVSPRVGELILVDDGSSDDPRAVVERLPQPFSARVRYVRQPNSGAATARARGQRMAVHEWLLFLDADDVLTPNAIEGLLAAAGEADAVYGDVELIDAQGGPVGMRDQRPPVCHAVGDMFLRAPLTGSVLIRRTRVGPYWSAAHQAVDEFFFHARAAVAGVQFRHVPGVVLAYRQHATVTRLSNQGFDYGAALGRAFLELDDALSREQKADARLSAYLQWVFLDFGTRAVSGNLRETLLSRATERPLLAALREWRFAVRWYGPRRVARMVTVGLLHSCRPAT